jgi:hypothetical protein
MPVEKSKEIWRAVAYIKSSKRRHSVFRELARQPQMASDLADKLGFSRQTASVFISHLKGSTQMGGEQFDLVECYTPQRSNYRIYGPTELGEKVAEQILDEG